MSTLLEAGKPSELAPTRGVELNLWQEFWYGWVLPYHLHIWLAAVLVVLIAVWFLRRFLVLKGLRISDIVQDLNRLKGTTKARLLSGFAMLGTLSVFLDPTDNWKFSLEAGLAFAGAFAMWIWNELAGHYDFHPQDVALFKKIMATIDAEERQLLRTRSFNQPFRWDELGGIEEISRWSKVEAEFLSKDLETKWKETFEKIGAFVSDLARRSLPIHGLQGMYSVKEGSQYHIWSLDVIYLDRSAEELASLIDELVRSGRRIPHD